MPSFKITSLKSVGLLVLLITCASVVLSVGVTVFAMGHVNAASIIVPLIVAPVASFSWGHSVLKHTQEILSQTARADESELKARAYESAIANLTHDLRTPVSQISGLLGLMEQRAPKGTQPPEELKMARTAAFRLSGMIQDVLDITRSEMDQTDVVRCAFNPGSLFEDLTQSFEFSAKLKKLELLFENQLSLASVVQDQKRIERITANLIDNAIKYTNFGYVKLRVANGPVVHGRSHILIEVEDTGIGIPREQLHQIFTKFERARNHFAIDGLGLGLALVSKFTDLIEGTVSVNSSLNQGTCFKVSVPCDVLEVAEDARTPVNQFRTCAQPHILLVEDDPLNMELAASVLAPFAQITRAANGLEAVQRFEHDRFDLVIMDCRMPVLDGVSAAIEMRNLEQELCDSRTPIWGLSANASAEERSKALNAGMEDLLAKPLTAAIAEQLLVH